MLRATEKYEYDVIIYFIVSGILNLVYLQSHYSVGKGAAFLGIGTDNVRYVPCDDKGRMRTDLLEKMIVEAKAEVS